MSVFRLPVQSGCFNPRPSCGTGATKALKEQSAKLEVSILARPVGRALQRPGCGQAFSLVVSILARPVGRALRSGCFGQRGFNMFQSSPVLWDGRYCPLVAFVKPH